MRILVCGSRYWTSEQVMRAHLGTLCSECTVIIHGGSRGADRMAGRLAQEYGYQVEEYKADWAKYGAAAGPIRNKEMLSGGSPSLVWAFHDNLQRSRGTKDMIFRARKAGLSVWLHRSDSTAQKVE